jgi:hypothetical protein
VIRVDPTGLSPAHPTQHFGANFTENPKPMSTAAHGNDQRTIVHSEKDWIRGVTRLGQETLAQQWRSAKLGNDLAYFG